MNQFSLYINHEIIECKLRIYKNTWRWIAVLNIFAMRKRKSFLFVKNKTPARLIFMRFISTRFKQISYHAMYYSSVNRRMLM